MRPHQTPHRAPAQHRTAAQHGAPAQHQAPGQHQALGKQQAHRAPGERGQASVELVGVVFVVVLVAVLAIQGITVAQTASITQEAARNGARALSQGQDWQAVVRRQVPGGLDLQDLDADIDRGAASVRVTLSAPLGLAGVDVTDVTVSRTAAFPVHQPRRTED